MSEGNLTYKIETAQEEDILAHLKACDNNFSPSLSTRVDLHSYSKIIFEKSITFESWQQTKLVGLIAAYFNDLENHSGFITNVSVMNNFLGRGVASKLMGMTKDYALEHNFIKMELEVSKNSLPAIQFYKKFGFFEIDRKEDNIIMKQMVSNKNN